MRERWMKARKGREQGGQHIYYHYIYIISVRGDGDKDESWEDGGKERREGRESNKCR